MPKNTVHGGATHRARDFDPAYINDVVKLDVETIESYPPEPPEAEDDFLNDEGRELVESAYDKADEAAVFGTPSVNTDDDNDDSLEDDEDA